MLASLNGFLKFLGRADCRAGSVKPQKQVYCAEERELAKLEYQRLLQATERQEQLWLVMQAICGTGIRVSELRFFTVEAVTRGEISVNCKAKTRVILIPGKLRRALLNYARKQKICPSGRCRSGRQREDGCGRAAALPDGRQETDAGLVSGAGVPPYPGRSAL